MASLIAPILPFAHMITRTYIHPISLYLEAAYNFHNIP